MTPETALHQAHLTAHDYALHAFDGLCGILSIDRRKDPKWREKLAPFASVLAAMMELGLGDDADYDTVVKAMREGEP